MAPRRFRRQAIRCNCSGPQKTCCWQQGVRRSTRNFGFSYLLSDFSTMWRELHNSIALTATLNLQPVGLTAHFKNFRSKRKPGHNSKCVLFAGLEQNARGGKSGAANKSVYGSPTFSKGSKDHIGR